MTTKSRRALSAVSLLALLAGTPSLAQDTPSQGPPNPDSPAPDVTDPQADEGEEVIVTATKRGLAIQDVPFSVNAQTQEDIQRTGAQNIEDISRNVAGLTVQNLGPGQSQVSVRGVSAGQVVRDQPGVKEQVGIYLDESVISLSLFTPDIDLFDLNRVETLRGPQGTLFGSGSVGGTIRYITNQPRTDRTEGVVEGNLNLVDGDDFGGHIKGAINLPLGDTLAVRAVGYYQKFGGFIDAIGPAGGEDVNDGERRGGRVSLLWAPTDEITITPRIVYQEVRADGFPRQEVFNFLAPAVGGRAPTAFREREQLLLLRESFSDDFLLADLTASVGFGGVELTSVTSYIDRDLVVSRDASALTGSVSVDLGFPAAAVLLPSDLRDTTDLKQFTQELRLSSDTDGPFQWLIGGFYSDIQRDYTQFLPTPGYDAFTDATLGAGTSVAVRNGFAPDSPYNSAIPYDIEQKAIFGEASYAFGQLTVTGGLRYYDFQEERTFRSGGLFANGDNRSDSTSSDGFTPRVLLAYELSEDITLNAQAAKGFRLGGVNDPLNLPLCSDADEAIFGGFQTYDDETLWNYEAGFKGSVAGLTLNAAGFYTDISDLQTTLDAGSCSSRVVFNVPQAHTMGFEAELSASPFEGLDLAISGSILEAEFDSTVTSGNGAVLAGIRRGNRLPSVPEFQIAANASYAIPTSLGQAYVAISAQHIGSRFTQASDQEDNPRTFTSGLAFGGATGTETTTVSLKLPSYEIVNLQVGLEMDGGFDLIAYVNNVLDENALLSFDRERGGRARLGFQVSQPRTFGVTARKAF